MKKLILLASLMLVGCSERDRMLFKFVSSGQAIDDAPVFTQVLRGNSLLAPPVMTITGVRNSDGDLLGRFQRRTRLPTGLVVPSDAPLAEESELYDVEILNGSTVVRTLSRIKPSDEWPAVLQSDRSNDPFDGITGNSLFGSASNPRSTSGITAISLQTIERTDNYVGANVAGGVGNFADSYFGLVDSVAAWQHIPSFAGDFFKYSIVHNGNVGVATILEQGVNKGTITFVNGDRIFIVIVGNQVRYYVNSMGIGAQPVYTSTTAPTLPLRVAAFVGENSGDIVSNVVMTIAPQPSFVYPATQQTVDFGSTQSAISVRIYQLGAGGRRGRPS